MIQAILRNAGTIVVSLALLGIVAAILLRLRKDRKQGKSPCGCGCASCPMASSCRSHGDGSH